MTKIKYEIKKVKNIEELKTVLDFCYSVLGDHLRYLENYTLKDWENRLKWSDVLLYAAVDNKPIAVVLGRPENDNSLVMGFVACDYKFRHHGITKNLIEQFEKNAKRLSFHYITLGSLRDVEEFYIKCGYRCVAEIHDQKIYQKYLN